MKDSPIKHFGFIQVTGAVPSVKPGDHQGNRESIEALYHRAMKEGSQLVVYPELSLSGYTLQDLFLQDQLYQSLEEQLVQLLQNTKGHDAPLVLGLPYRSRGQLFNLGLVLQSGKILGAVPKTYLPNTREFYEQRWFSSSVDLMEKEGRLAGQTFPMGRDLIFQDHRDQRFSFALEICEDLWAPQPPGGWHSLAGASMVLNLSASNELVGKQDYRKQLIAQQSARNLGGYLYVSAGPGESTTDTVYSGRAMAFENGHQLGESPAYTREGQLLSVHFDMDYLDHERRNSSSYRQAVQLEKQRLVDYRFVDCSLPLESLKDNRKILRPMDRHPFVPGNPAKREARCKEIFAIQSQALVTRMQHIGCKNSVIGLSGGLDSTLALLVVIQAYKSMDLPLSGIHGYTLPGFGTTKRTKNNITRLCEELEIPLETVDIEPACMQQFKDLNHSPEARDITYENVQARQRTYFLMNKANQVGGIVIGTGDLSELALGWCTYNGDHMSMYAVNTGVPKTLVRYLVEYVAGQHQGPARDILLDISDTPISPELLPPDDKGEIAQKTEESVGPYELHDFFLYQIVRCGYAPQKVERLAIQAFEGVYDSSFIRKWLKNFYHRFFQQQFKRSCLPDGPKVGTIALSPRADWRMPSDASVKEWLRGIR